MRALRVLLIVAVVLGVLFVVVDRVAVHFAEDKAAERIKSTENLASKPDVSIKGFPFLTQVASGELDDVQVGIKDLEADTGDGAQKIRVDGLTADMKGVRFSGDYSSAVADRAAGQATVAYAELLKTAKAQPTDVGLGITARVVSLADGGHGKIKIGVQFSVLRKPLYVLSSVTVRYGKLRIAAEGLPQLLGFDLPADRVRSITDFQQAIDRLPGGIRLDAVRAVKGGVEITMKGSKVRLAG
ncbi:DUF2993 domain-containing protein [Streptomyces sp. NPDC046985]|uniref:LmeA family phospholipid-binding protein n=1 Tax=Streptomyces sp. NPDC046985 TaxID=3155377 RepID=UPI0034072AA2